MGKEGNKNGNKNAPAAPKARRSLGQRRSSLSTAGFERDRFGKLLFVTASDSKRMKAIRRI